MCSQPAAASLCWCSLKRTVCCASAVYKWSDGLFLLSRNIFFFGTSDLRLCRCSLDKQLPCFCLIFLFHCCHSRDGGGCWLAEPVAHFDTSLQTEMFWQLFECLSWHFCPGVHCSPRMKQTHRGDPPRATVRLTFKALREISLQVWDWIGLAEPFMFHLKLEYPPGNQMFIFMTKALKFSSASELHLLHLLVISKWPINNQPVEHCGSQAHW